MLSVKCEKIMFLKTYAKFDHIPIRFTDQNCRSLEIEDKVSWHCVLINEIEIFCRNTGKN